MTLNDFLDNLSSKHLYVIGPFFQGSMPVTDALVFVDRGADFRTDQEGFSVGDGDSASVQLDEILNPDKNFSDLAYVLERIPARISRISLLGFLGGRKDHELMNLAEAHQLLKKSSEPLRLDFDSQIEGFSSGLWSIPVQGVFSLFAFEELKLKMTGDCRYPVSPVSEFKALSSQGLSNEGSGLIAIEADSPVFIFTNKPT